MSKINIIIPKGAQEILKTLQKAGHQAYVVGGCVRDSLLGKEPHDWDICTDATPEEVERCFIGCKIIETGIKHGTVTIMVENDAYEVTTYRTEGDYSDHRRPDSVSFVNNLAEDLCRRDFTINAMAYNDDGLVDMFGGQHDLTDKLIRCVGSPEERFKEDALRMLRAIRFASTYGFGIEVKTAEVIHKMHGDLKYVARERICAELCKTLYGRGAEDLLMEFQDVLCEIIPEMQPCVGFKQNNRYHCYDVYKHSIKAFGAYKGTDVSVKLALLLHDIGKPYCYVENETGGHFYGHAKISKDIAKSVLDSLRVDNQTRHDVLELILYHDTVTEVSERFVKKWLNKIGESQFRRLMEVRRADVLAQSGLEQEQRLAKCAAVTALIDKVINEKQPFSLKDLCVSGKDIINLGIPEGKQVGEILNALLDKVIFGELDNSRESLLAAATEMQQSF